MIYVRKYHTVKEVAKELHRHPRTIYRRLDGKFLRGKKVNDGWLIPEEELKRIIREKWDEPQQCMTFDDNCT